MERATGTATGKPCALFGVAVSDEDRFIAVAHDNGVIGLWQPTLAAVTGLATPFIEGRGHTHSARAVAFEPPGSRDYACLATGSVDSTIRTWHVGDRSMNSVLRHHDSSVMCLAFDRAGTRLVSGSEDRTIAIARPTSARCAGRATASRGAAATRRRA